MDSTLSDKSEAGYSSRECTPCRQGGFRCGKELPVCVSCRNRMGLVACAYPIVIRDQNRRHVFGVYMDDFDVTRDIDSATPPPGTAPSLIKIDHLQFLLMRLPSLAVCEVLWDAFLDSVYPIYPLIDLEFFWLWHAEFWEAYGTCRDFNAFRPLILKNPSMICLLLAVLCSGAAAAHKDVWADPPLLTEDRHSVIFSLATGGQMALKACAFNDIPTLYTITSSLLLDLALGRPVESSGRKFYIKTMTVAAQRVGINSTWTSDPATQQLCRRLWEHIRWLDAQCCIAIGIASEEPFREELIGDKARQPPAISDSNGDIAALLSYARAEVACFEHRIIGHVRGTFLDDQRTRVYDGQQLEDVKSVLHGIKAQMGQLPEWDDLDLVKIDVEWAKSVIDMLSLEAVVVDFVPNVHKSLHLKNQDNWTLFSLSANKYLQAYLALATDTRLERYSWFLSHYRAAFLQCLYLQLIGLSMWPGDGETATTVDEMMQHMENRQTSECEDTETFQKLKTMYVRVLRVN